MNKSLKELKNVLNIFEDCRIQLAKSFLEEDPDIYGPLYKYEEKPTQMSLAIEMFFLCWLSSHFEEFSKIKNKGDIESNFGNDFLSSYIKLTKTFSNNQKSNTSDIFQKTVNIKIKFLEELISIGDKADKSKNYLTVEKERIKSQYKKKIKKYLGDRK